MMEQRLAMGWPGLTQEVTDICQIIRFPNVMREYVTKKEIKESISLHHLKVLKEEMEGKKKLRELACKDLRVPHPEKKATN